MIEITASAMTTGLAHLEASGKMLRQNRIIPKVPILSRTLTSRTAVPGVASLAASGSQVCTGHIGALIANATKNPRNSQRPVVVLMSAFIRSCSRYDGPDDESELTTYRPTTDASIRSPPNRLNSKNFTEAY